MSEVQTLACRAFLLGEWRVEPELNRLSKGDRVIQLEPRLMEVLTCLADRRGLPVSRRDLLDTVWRAEFVSDNTLSSAVAELRRALDDDARNPRYIETISKRGYRMVADVVILEPPNSTTRAPVDDTVVAVLFGGSGEEYRLCEGEHLLGRGSDADIVVDSSKVSRHHARIRIASGGAVIEDLGSKNGTFIRDHRVTAPHSLIHGDEIRLGHALAVFRFAWADGPTATETTGGVGEPDRLPLDP